VPVMMIDYMGPSLDTTIFGISSGVWLFANHPDQWDLVRNDPSLIPAAINEILRMEAPIQDFSRYVARDYDLDGVSLQEGSRAIIFYGAANRDPRQFTHPDQFDVRRWLTHLFDGDDQFAEAAQDVVRRALFRLDMEACDLARKRGEQGPHLQLG